MGLLPLEKDMPLRITTTDPRNKGILFKNRRCRLFGWTLHEEDKARLDQCTASEMKLQHQPKELFVQMDKATWIWSKDLGPGVIGLAPTTVTWHVDKMKKVAVQRRGFTIASDFSGTAHSFAGDSLKSAYIDCLPWDRKPDVQAQVSAYMCISRLQHIDDMCITQPYAPTLFEQGEPPGPDLLLRFLRNEVPVSQLGKEWAALKDVSSKERKKWPEDMPLYCRGCSAAAGEDVFRRAKQFPHSGPETLWKEVVCKGMERFCEKCSSSHGKAELTSEGQVNKDTTANLCAWCGMKPCAQKTSTTSHVLCSTCILIRIKCQRCSKSKKKDVLKQLTAFNMDRVLHCKRQRTLTSRAICLACDKGEAVKPREKPKQNSYECSFAGKTCHCDISMSALS